MYCVYLSSMLGFGYAFYLIVRYSGGTTMSITEAIITVSVALIAAAATIMTGIINNRKTLQDVQHCVESTKEMLIRATDDNCNGLSTEHQQLSEKQNLIILDTRKVTDYVSKQEAIASAVHQESFDIQKIVAQLMDLSKRLGDAEGQIRSLQREKIELKQMLLEKEQALRDAETKLLDYQTESNTLPNNTDEEDWSI